MSKTQPRNRVIIPPQLALLHRTGCDARKSIDRVQMQLNSQLPFSYVHLIVLLVHTACFFTAIRCGLETAAGASILSILCEVPESRIQLCFLAKYLKKND